MNSGSPVNSKPPTASQKRRALFLCTGNSCRSQMAEALANQLVGDRWEAFSAGTKPAGYVHPRALQVLEEIGVHHQGRSKSVDELRNLNFDLVVTVCDSAADECPVWLGSGHRVHLGFPDPAAEVGEEAEVLAVFRRVRDAIRREIPPLLEEYESVG